MSPRLDRWDAVDHLARQQEELDRLRAHAERLRRSKWMAGDVMTGYRPGSADWASRNPWAEEAADTIRRNGDHLADLILDIAEDGVHEPVLLGDDGRVWDGHHRIIAARFAGSYLRVEFGHTKEATA